MNSRWKKKELGDLADFFSGGTPSKSNAAYWGDEIPWITVRDMKRMDFKKSGISLSAEGASTLRLMPADTVFILVRGMGLLKDVPVVYSDVPATFNQDIKALIAKQDINPEFLAYSLTARKNEILRLVDRAGHGTGRLDTDLLKGLPMPVPPRQSQDAIVALLKTWDQAINTLSLIREAKNKQRQYFRNAILTGKKRLPGFNKKWEKVALNQVLHEHGKRSTGVESVYSVSVHKGLVDQVEHLGRSFSAENTSHYNLVLPGDLVYTKSPTGDFPLGIIKLNRTLKNVLVSPLYGVYTPVNCELGTLLEAYFESPVSVRNYLQPLVQKGAKNTIAITNKRFLQGELSFPTAPEEQKAIAELLITSAIELKQIANEIEMLHQQKRGLMQKLLTGEWRNRA